MAEVGQSATVAVDDEVDVVDAQAVRGADGA